MTICITPSPAIESCKVRWRSSRAYHAALRCQLRHFVSLFDPCIDGFSLMSTEGARLAHTFCIGRKMQSTWRGKSAHLPEISESMLQCKHQDTLLQHSCRHRGLVKLVSEKALQPMNILRK